MVVRQPVLCQRLRTDRKWVEIASSATQLEFHDDRDDRGCDCHHGHDRDYDARVHGEISPRLVPGGLRDSPIRRLCKMLRLVFQTGLRNRNIRK